MSNFVLSEDVIELIGIVPTNDDGTINGAWYDRKACESITMRGYTGAASGSPTAQTTDFKLQDADTIAGAGSADVTDGAMTQITADDGDVSLDIDARGIKQFVRMVAVTVLTAGTAPKLPVAGTLIFGNTKKTPNPVVV